MSLGRDNDRWVLLNGTSSDAQWEVAVAERDDWSHTRLYAGGLDVGESREIGCGEWEFVVVPLSGRVRVEAVDASGRAHGVDLAGRASVFSGPTDIAFVPSGSTLTVSAAGAVARVALCGALVGDLASARRFTHIAAHDVPVELRGAGIASRQVRNFGIPGVLAADRIIACEVVTPAGNWSSWPPHKHDVEREGLETELEEIYYFEVQPAVGSTTDPVGYQRVYGSVERPIDVLAEVRSGDVVLVPHGWHGPAIAAPDADLYYLNVMAGPGPTREWLICDDPAHAAVRDGWADLPADPRMRGGSHSTAAPGGTP